jgi:superfamily II DNA or RNA helicase
LKRQHQIEFENAIDSIIAGNPARQLIANVTPGGGKSALPIIAGKLIGAGLIDKLLWICPRSALQVQGERSFIDPLFRSMFCHNYSIRSSTNEVDPSRGLNGFITTYQAAGVDDHKTILQELHKWRYAVILDEFHHVEKGGEWHKALIAIIKAAKYHILMTGTLQRGDDKKIAFIDYETNSHYHRPALVSDEKQFVITYTRSQALQDRAILPIHFVFCDGRAAWENRAGDQVNVNSFYNVLPKEKGHALYAALSTEFAEQLLSLALNHYVEYRQSNRTARLLVVTANITEARRHFDLLKRYGYDAAIATSHDSDEAVRNIEAFKSGSINILVTIAMAYEGLDVPEISHIACLTHFRTKPWIEQMFARAVRINRQAGAWSDQVAYVFVPDDIVMREIVQEIDAEQLRHAKDSEARSRILTPGVGKNIPPIRPLSSAATSQRETTLDQTPLTPKQEEETILRKIEGHIRRFAFANRLEARTINTELVRQFGKSRRSMPLTELKSLLMHVQKVYPLGVIVRGTGKPRLPTKPEFVQTELFTTEFMEGFNY